MKAVGDIRLGNLELLVEQAGTLAAIAEAAGTSSVYLSQIRNRSLDSKTLKPREMGASMARRIEAALQLPSGWMDSEHEDAAAPAATPKKTPAANASTPSIGQTAMAMGASVAGLSESRRKTISALVAAQIYDKPDSQEAQAIDALAPGLTVAVPAGWRELAHRTATNHPDAAVREILTKFVDEIDRQAHAGSHAPAHQAKSILKI